MTHRALLASVDAEELSHWEEFWRLEPFGDEWRSRGRICETVAMSGGVKKKDGGRLTEEDFMPDGYRAANSHQDSADAIETQLLGWAKATNSAAKKVKKKK